MTGEGGASGRKAQINQWCVSIKTFFAPARATLSPSYSASGLKSRENPRFAKSFMLRVANSVTPADSNVRARRRSMTRRRAKPVFLVSFHTSSITGRHSTSRQRGCVRNWWQASAASKGPYGRSKTAGFLISRYSSTKTCSAITTSGYSESHSK